MNLSITMDWVKGKSWSIVSMVDIHLTTLERGNFLAAMHAPDIASIGNCLLCDKIPLQSVLSDDFVELSQKLLELLTAFFNLVIDLRE